MGVIISVSGHGTICAGKDKEPIDLLEYVDELKSIKDGWNEQAFDVSESGEDFEFNSSQIEGADPYNDGVALPLDRLIQFAKERGLSVYGDFIVTSDWSDLDNIQVTIKDNAYTTGNSEIVNASTDELIDELKERGNLVHFDDEDKNFISDCLLSYQEVLVKMQGKTFGAVSDALQEQISKIADINRKIVGKD